MQRANLKSWLLIGLIPALLLLTCCDTESYPISGYYVAIVRTPPWEWNSSLGIAPPVNYLMSAGGATTNIWGPVITLPGLFSNKICDPPGQQRMPTVKINNNIPNSTPEAAIRYLVFSPEHPAGLSTSDVKEIETLLAKPAPPDWGVISAKIQELIDVKYPYAGKVQPGGYVEVPNLFTW